MIILSFFLFFVIKITSVNGYLSPVRGWLKTVLQCILALVWGISIYARMRKGSMRRYLLAIDLFVLLWLIERSCKYFLLQGYATATRYFWYMFYIPMELMILFAIFTAFCMGKAEDYKLSWKIKMLYIPTILTIGAVITNDLHRMVFTFPENILNDGDRYSYGPLYFVVLFWMLFLIFLFFVILFKRCHLPEKGKRLLLPFIPIFIGILYGVIYAFNFQFAFHHIGDMTSMFCCCMVLTYEICVQTGLIPSNTHYKKLFRLSIQPVQIVNSKYQLFLSSYSARDIQPNMKRLKDRESIMLGKMKLSKARITGGYVVWTQDMSQLLEMKEKLEDTNEHLLGKNHALRERYETSRKRQHLVEQNRIYNIMQDQTAEKVLFLQRIVDKFENTKSISDERSLLMQMCILTIYIKRRNNLLFLSQEDSYLSSAELYNYVRETTQYLKIYGIICEYKIDCSQLLSFSDIVLLHDTLYNVIEKIMMLYLTIFLHIHFEGNQAHITWRVAGPDTLKVLCIEGISVERETEREWRLSYDMIVGEADKR